MSSSNGQRLVEDEKRVLTELGRFFHVAKANHKEAQNAAAAPSTASGAATGAAQGKTKKAKKAAADTRRGSQRRSRHGGSIWIVLKGGFAKQTVPLSSQAKQVRDRAQMRAQRSERTRLEALQMAEAYVQSAWSNAQEAGLAVKDDTTGQLVPTAEGESYVREQYAIAARMLRPPAVGARLQHVVAHSTAAVPAAAAAVSEVALPPYSGGEPRPTWESVVPRELAILNYGSRAGNDAEEKVRAQVEGATSGYYFPLAEPAAKEDGTSATAGHDIMPTKCILRVSSSQRQRHTAVLSSAKSVNYFKSNFMAVLRKELSGSKLPRGAEETLDGDEHDQPTTGSGKNVRGQPQPPKSGGGKSGKHKKK